MENDIAEETLMFAGIICFRAEFERRLALPCRERATRNFGRDMADIDIENFIKASGNMESERKIALCKRS